MSAEASTKEQKKFRNKVVTKNRTSEAVYGFGLIGAWIYYITTAPSFWVGVLGIVKGIFWPAMLVYELMKFLAM